MTGGLPSPTDAPAAVDPVALMVDAIVSNPLLLGIVVIAILLNFFSPPAKRRRRRR